MALRVPEAGDEIDGHIIDDVGEPRAIGDRHSVLFARMRDGTYQLVSITEPRAGRTKMSIWKTDNPRARAALDTSVEFPVAASGAAGEVRVWGKDKRGSFSALFYYAARKTSGMIDTFNYT